MIKMRKVIDDMFVDANIQNRWDGQFDLFEKADLRIKMEKNDTSMGIEEATLYFKFYYKRRNNFIGYDASHQELYWIFHPYYKAAYQYAGVIESHNKFRISNLSRSLNPE